MKSFSLEGSLSGVFSMPSTLF
jgi:hypothetical protein